MKIVWSLFAVQDLVSIRAYIAEYHPKAAENVAHRILHSVSLLADHPLLGMPTHRTGVRKLIVKNSPYSIPYRIADGEIEILEVFDGRQNAPRTDLNSV